MQRLKAIQALRAIAASLVFLCHLVPIEQRLSARAEPLTDFWLAGAFGVDLFFVISGFVIVWVAADSPPGGKSPVGFLFARVTRIYPTWWLMCGLMMLGFFMLHGVPWNPVRVLEQDLNGPSHVIHSLLLWPQDYHPVLGPGWTLVHELYFYLGFGLLVATLPPRLRLHGVFVWGALVAIGALLGLSSDFGRTAIEVVFYPMTLQFVFGALVAYAIQAGWRRYAWPLAIIGGVLFLLAFLLSPAIFNLQPVVPLQWSRTFLFGLPAALFIYGLVALELRGAIGQHIPKPLVILGDWSYSLYLCHFLTITAAGRLTLWLMGGPSDLSTVVFFVNGVIATLIVSGFTYYGFERPVNAYFRARRPGRHRAPKPAIGAVR